MNRGCDEPHWGHQWEQFRRQWVSASWCWFSASTTTLSKCTKLHHHLLQSCSTHWDSTCHWDGLSDTWGVWKNKYPSVTFYDNRWLINTFPSLRIFWWMGKPVLVEPPASFVFFGTVSVVVIVVLVIGAKFNALVTGPVWNPNLIGSRKSISSCTYIDSKAKAVMILKESI